MENEKGKDKVMVTIDNKEVSLHRGRRAVAEIKSEGTVPQAYDLEQVIEGVMTPLDDNESVTIKGGEVFVSHPKDGESS